VVDFGGFWPFFERFALKKNCAKISSLSPKLIHAVPGFCVVLNPRLRRAVQFGTFCV